jgi:hypothetical protein
MKFLAFVVATVLTLWGTYGRWWTLPDRHNPWAPLAYDEPANWLTRYKLQQLSAQPEACAAFMATTPWQYQTVPDRAQGDSCGWQGALQVRRTALRVGPSFTLTCPAAASLALWERHVVQPEAELLLGSPVQQLEHFGSYACRNVYGREEGQRSQHATANALDVAGFVLADGRRISVARDWHGDGAPAAYLRSIRGGACHWFNGVLSPDYNQAHADHFHLDKGPYRMCR